MIRERGVPALPLPEPPPSSNSGNDPKRRPSRVEMPQVAGYDESARPFPGGLASPLRLLPAKNPDPVNTGSPVASQISEISNYPSAYSVQIEIGNHRKMVASDSG